MFPIFLIFLLIYSNFPIGKIKIFGARSFKEKELIRVLGLKKGENFSPPILRSSLLRLENYYKGKGFFEVTVESTKVEKRKEKIFISIFLSEGRRKYIGQILFRGAEVIDSAILLKIYGHIPPYPYDVDILGDGESKILEAYAERGFPYIEISRDEDILNGDTLIIVYTIDEGPRVYIRKIILEGNKKVRRKILEREVDIKPGDLYKSSKIIETKRRLFSTGLFRSVRHELREIHGKEDSIDVAL